MLRILLGVVLVVGLLAALVYIAGRGTFGEVWHEGVPVDTPIPAKVVAGRDQVQRVASRLAGIPEPKQILFGDLHVHSTFSTDAFLMSLPLNGGDGARPVSDACDFARYCSALDFWSINDHALALTPRRWAETLESMRRCDEVAGDPATPDVVPFLGWEWTQVGTTPENHWGHKNVVFKHLDADRVPTRPIAAGFPRGADPGVVPPTMVQGLLALLGSGRGGNDLVAYIREQTAVTPCPEGVPVRDLPADCFEAAPTPAELFAKLDDWGFESIVIPHGTTWGYYTPMGSTWDKQLTRSQHDPARQRLVEVYSGHGNSEEYRPWRSVRPGAGGKAECPAPSDGYLPSCWRAGEIIRERCLQAGEDDAECEARAAEARANYVAADVSGFLTVPGATAADWEDSGQCRDCFLPAFNTRPGSSVQYMMALSNAEGGGDPLRFRFGFIASSDVHSARPGTGYKEYARSTMTELRFGNFSKIPVFRVPSGDPEPRSRPFDPAASGQAFFGLLETERQASFFLTGGLVAAHARERSRDGIWDALQRREVYGTSGPRILLWFDRVDPDSGDRMPMGSVVRSSSAPLFQVRALGSFEQQPGCPDYAAEALTPERLASLCRDECYNPSDRRRAITRVEVVRIRPRVRPEEPVDGLIEDPWRVLPCQPDPAGCRVTFDDPDFPSAARDTLYYVRAIEEPSLAVDADGVGCLGVPEDEDCLGEVEERAWSSPIFVDWAGG
jgi:hypothetical protein